MFFEKTNEYKIYLFNLTNNNIENKVKISVGNTENTLEWTTNVNSFIELVTSSNLDFLDKKCNAFIIPLTIMQKIYNSEKILINLEFL